MIDRGGFLFLFCFRIALDLAKAEFMVSFGFFDANRDGYIFGAEFHKNVLASSFLFAVLDANDDGKVDRRENNAA